MRETRNLEFKQDITNSFLKTVSAFANYGSGEIKFGVKDDGTIIGIENQRHTNEMILQRLKLNDWN